MNFKNILRVAVVVLFAVLLNSCNSNKEEGPNFPNIKGVDENVSLIVNQLESFELSGGDGKFKVKVEDSNIATTTLDGKMLTVMGVTEGMTKLTITSVDKVLMVNVKVMQTPAAGVYMGTERKVEFNNFAMNNQGVWMLEKSGNPYNGKRLYVPILDNSLTKGQSVSLNIKSFNIEGLESGEQSAMVELVTQEVVKVKIGEVSVVVPRVLFIK